MMKCFKRFYENKKVLVTGHTGFKGSWLTLWLKELGAKVIGYSLDIPTEPSMFNSLNLQQHIEHIIGDVRDLNKLTEVFKEHKPEIVFHLAAQPLVRLSYKQPIETFSTNIQGTINILETARHSESIRTIVNVTSDKCYENKETDYAYKEDDAMGGYDPYSASKGCSELITSCYRQSFFNDKELKIGLASVRAGNVIGGGDWAADRLVPDCIRFLIDEKEIITRNPDSIRPWQHVLEPLSGYLWLGVLLNNKPKDFSSGWNFGPDNSDAITVEDLISKVIDIWGKGNYKVIPDPNMHEAKLLRLNIKKSKKYLEWQPVMTAKQAIEKTVDWYKSFYNMRDDMYNKTIEQLREYIDLARKENLNWTKAD